MPESSSEENFRLERVLESLSGTLRGFAGEKASGGVRQDDVARARLSPQRRLKVAIVAPSLRYVGGQAVQADLLCAYGKAIRMST